MSAKKLNGGALQLVTFISVIIALLLTAFVLLLHTQKQFKTKTDLITRTIQHTSSELLAVLQTDTDLKDHFNLSLNDGTEVEIIIKPWGIFQTATASSRFKNIRHTQNALIGYSNPYKDEALFLKDVNKPLVLVGNTKIRGDVHLPKRGIKSGNIQGVAFNHKNLIDGDVRTINQFPKIAFTMQNYLHNISAYFTPSKDMLSFDLRLDKSYSNSFGKSTLVFHSDEMVYINQIISGNIVIQSSEKIVVSQSSKLSDIIFIAPIIEIESHTKGAFQAFASEKILVGKNCKLSYPSALVLNRKFNNPFDRQSKVRIDSGTAISGAILVKGRKEEENFEPQLEIKNNTTINGEIYAEQTVELRGKVFGTVYTKSFLTRANGSYYHNHLLDVEISKNELNNEYVGIPIVDSKKSIAKWLY